MKERLTAHPPCVCWWNLLLCPLFGGTQKKQGVLYYRSLLCGLSLPCLWWISLFGNFKNGSYWSVQRQRTRRAPGCFTFSPSPTLCLCVVCSTSLLFQTDFCIRRYVPFLSVSCVRSGFSLRSCNLAPPGSSNHFEALSLGNFESFS